MSLNEKMKDAIKKGNIEAIDQLLGKGIDIDGDENNCPLGLASIYGNIEIVLYLLSKGADIHTNDDCALRWAATNGRLETVKLLLSKGADINADEDGALAGAASLGHIDVVKFLVSKGADVHARDEMALCCAANRGNKEIVSFLLSKSLSVPIALDRVFRYMAANDIARAAAFLMNNCKAIPPQETLDYLKNNHKDFLKPIIIRKYVPRAQPRKEAKPLYRQSQN